jgi:2-oxoisovalerate dehydrogenase E2 component (dihydrolipoyl transacylase)
MPQLGESVAEGTIGKWLKKPGDSVAKYEPLLEVITDKVNAEVPSPFEGTLKEILVEEGATVPNNAEIAVIEEAGPRVAAALHEGRRALDVGEEEGDGPRGSRGGRRHGGSLSPRAADDGRRVAAD